MPGYNQPNPMRAVQPLDFTSSDQRAFADLRRVVREATRLLSLHRWFFFLPFCLVTSAVFVFSLYLPREYKATTTVEIAADPLIANLSSSFTSASFDKFRGTVENELRSPELHSAVLSDLGVKGGPRNAASLRRALAEQLEITSSAPSERMDLVQLSYTGPDPQFGRRFLDALKVKYIEKAAGELRDSLLQQSNYLRQEYEQVRQDILQAQREETQLRLENPYVNPTDPGALSLRIAQLESERRDLLLRRREYQSEVASLESLLAHKQAEAVPADPASDGPHVPPSQATRDLNGEIAKIESQILELRRARGMTDQHPELSVLLAHLASLKERLKTQQDADRVRFSEGGNNAAQMLLDELPELARLRDALAAQQSKLRETELSLESNQLTIEQLQAARNGVFTKQEQFVEVMSRIQKAKARETQLQAALSQLEPAIRAVEQNGLIRFTPGPPARVSDRPVAPNPTTVILFAIFAGLASGIIGLVLGEVFDQSFHSADQVASSLNLPLLEVIGEIARSTGRRNWLFGRALAAQACAIAGLLAVMTTGSLAYLCTEQPKLYQKVTQFPLVAAGFISGSEPDEG